MSPALDIDQRPLDSGVELILEGELDITTVPALRNALRDLRDRDVALVRLDISQLAFMDSTGLRTLLDTSRQADVEGWRLALTRAPAHVQQMFELTRTEGFLRFDD
jgi:anti-anti-sigma factor